MNKSDIYKIIGYNGEYNNNVKKALRKILKENHPDLGGSIETFKLINEVKKELEDNKVSYHTNKNKNNNKFDDIDYDFCIQKKRELENKKIQYKKEIDEIKEKIRQNATKYGILFQNSIDIEAMLHNNDTKNINFLMIIICLICTILFIVLGITIITKNISLLLPFVIILVLLMFNIYIFFKKTKKYTNDKNNILNQYFKTINEIKKNNNLKKELDSKKRELEIKISKIDNDVRFYNNILKKE